jgi:hypothetical protein
MGIMRDDSAIAVNGNRRRNYGEIYLVSKGKMESCIIRPHKNPA